MFWTDFAPPPALLFIIVTIASFAGTWGALVALRRRAILDHPNERSSHASPTPRGAGVAVVPVAMGAWLFIGLQSGQGPREIAALAAAVLGLGLLSWRDDLGGLPVGWRLLGQGAAIGFVLAVAPVERVFQGLLPPALDLLATGILWLWFVNLFNFMDGIDGLTGVETIAIGMGVVLVSALPGGGTAPDQALGLHGLAIAAAALGFLWWNWHPARIFLGDVGSIPLGFMLGWLLFKLAAGGQWEAAIILPLYYLADATLTLARRALRRQPVWKAHREHFYQRAVQRGLSHGTVVAAIVFANAVLVGLAVLATLAAPRWPALSLLVSAVVVALLLFWLSPGPGRAGSGRP